MTATKLNEKRLLKVVISACACGFSLASYAETTSDLSFDDLLSLSIADLTDLPIYSASQFSQSSLTVPSSVSLILPADWENTGARNIN